MNNVFSKLNPTSRVLGVLLLSLPLLFSLDSVSALGALVIALALVPLSGVSYSVLLRRLASLLVVAPLSGLSMLLYGKPGGEEYFSWSVVHITQNSVMLSIALMLRVVALGSIVIVMTHGINITSLGDGLAQVWHLPARFVIGAMSAFQMLTLLRGDYGYLKMARRSRGLAQGNRIREFCSIAFILIVVALRRGNSLSVTMEARGFGAPIVRTWARKSFLTWRDGLFILACILLGIAPLWISYALGYFRFIGA